MPQAQTRTTDWRINEREDIQFLLGNPPSWTMRYGIMVVAIVFSVLLLLSYVIKYPDVVTARVVLTTENPPIRNSGQKIKFLTHVTKKGGSNEPF